MVIPSVSGDSMQITPNALTDGRWSHMLNYENGADVASATHTGENRIFVNTTTKNLYYKNENLGSLADWKTLTNWKNVTALDEYATEAQTDVRVHEAPGNSFFLADPTLDAFHRLNVEKFSTPKFSKMASPGFFDTDNTLIINDSFTDSGGNLKFENAVILLKTWNATFPSYIEWELVSKTNSNIRIDLTVGFINKLAYQGIPTGSITWGIASE